jgi:hypothetical protein
MLLMCYQTRLDYSQAIKKPLPGPSQLDFPHHSLLGRPLIAGLVAACPHIKGILKRTNTVLGPAYRTKRIFGNSHLFLTDRTVTIMTIL